MIASQLMAAGVLVALALPVAGADATPTRRTPFTHFGSEAAIELVGDGASSSLSFGNRNDELVTRATLRFVYTFSPALAPGASVIKVSLNDEEVGTLPVTAKGAGTPLARTIEIDPRLVAGSNRLTLSLTAAQGPKPEEETRPGLWAEVSGASELEIAYRPLAVADDLAILPEPFFDKRDQRRVIVPFVFNSQPSATTLGAAAVVASWLGRLAEWRGARFPPSLEAPAPGHAIAFVANDERPAFLASVPRAAGPELRMMANPSDGRSKLLLVMGRDAREVRLAAEALVTGPKVAGPAAKVQAVQAPPRAAYDAPANVVLDRPVRLAELLEWEKQLETSGRPPVLPRVHADLRVPPDLATWRGPGVPLALKVHYRPVACTAESQLEVGIDGDPFQVMALPTRPETMTEEVSLHIPAFRLRPRMRLQFTFRFIPKADAACLQAAPTIKASVSPDSTIDLSGFPHYAQMPNLNHFATVGFPFTKYADLSQAVVVLPERPVAADIETMLGLMGRMGEATNYPATRVRVATPRDEAALVDADLLLVGATPQQSLLVKWANRLPVMLTGYGQRAAAGPEPTRLAAVRGWLGIGNTSDLPPPAPVSFDSGGPLASVFGFESPVTKGRSVVAVTAVAPEQVPYVLDALEDSRQRTAMRGNAAFLLPGKVESALVGKTYETGYMPPWTGITYWLEENPVVLWTLVIGAILVLIGLAWFASWQVSAWRARRAA